MRNILARNQNGCCIRSSGSVLFPKRINKINHTALSIYFIQTYFLLSFNMVSALRSILSLKGFENCFS